MTIFSCHSQVGTVTVPYPPGGLFPAVGMHSEGEEVKLNLDAEWQYEELILMAVDSGEEEWSRLHDVKLNGMVRFILKRTHKKIALIILKFELVLL